MHTVSLDRLRQLFTQSALAWLAAAALMGVWLRWQSWGQPPVVFQPRHLTHAHSHLMFLGWVFNALAALLIPAFISGSVRRTYLWLWLGLQTGVLGMALAFPVQGYGAVSIAFSTLHMALAGWLAIRLLRDAGAGTPAHAALHWAAAFLFVSAAGPFALGYVMARGLQATNWYNLAVYFYLHFQYNGWMVFALLAVLLRWRPQAGRRALRAVHLLGAGCCATFAISVLWTRPPLAVNAVAALGALLQWWGVILLIRSGWGASWPTVWRNRWARRLAGLALFSFFIKLSFQATAFLPGLGDLVFANRNWLVAYFHLVFIGVILLAIMALFLEKNDFAAGKRLAPGWWLLIGGYILTEILLVLPHTSAAGLFAASLGMLCGLLYVLVKTHTT